MPRARVKPAVSVPRSSAHVHASLCVQRPPERLVALEREHQRLQKQIARKKKEIDALTAQIDEADRLFASTRPKLAEAQALSQEIHRLFRELVARKGQPRGVRATVKSVYEMVRASGVLPPIIEDPSIAPWSDIDAESDSERIADAAHDEPPPWATGGFSARPADQGPAAQPLRELYRNLARALHPDMVQDEREKARRTEAMKEVTRAYEEADVARLLHLERIWVTGNPLERPGDEVERRCAALERLDEALRTQLAALAKELRELRRSPEAQLLREIGRMTGAGARAGVPALVAEADEALANLREIRDFVVSYRDGRITLDEFVKGPRHDGDDDLALDDEDDLDLEDELDFEELLDELVEMMSSVARAQPRRGKRRRRQAR